MTTSTSKIEPHHLRLQAVVYIRQSTPQQIQNNQESTRRQYDLACRARQMGWPETAVRVIDDDLGLSGTGSRNRAGFQRLVAAIGLGEVGIILVTEVSRLSRLSSDWHRVIELCAVFRTLIADEDGIYDAQSPNDRLLLGVKGTLFAAELHILQARMRGALLSKARRGELAVTLPVGYRRRPDGAVVQDPDEAVRLAVATVFERFSALGNARAVLRHLAGSNLAFPRLVQAGPEMGRIAWVRPTYGMIHRMLVNPTYAGAFVYGRCRQEVSAGDPPTVAERRLPPEEWAIVVQGVYPGYISYDTFLANRRQLHGNRYNFEAKGRGAPREGTALLQGLVRCGRCGQQMGISYGRQRPRYQCRRAQTDLALAGCQSFLAGEIDARVVMAFLDAVRPAGLEATLAALRDLEEERHAVERQWQLRLERARYEARLARRQYDTVDPDNRLVARELERRWEAALAEVERLEQDHERMRRTELRPLEPADIADVRRLAADLPALWHADTTLPADRKRLLRLVIAAVTVTVAGDRRAAEVVILWSGGATTRHHVVGRPFGWHLRTEAEMLGLIRELAEKMPDHQVAAALAGLGLCTRHRKSWTRARVASMRRQHGIPTACPTQTGHQTCRADGLVPARVAGERLGMTLAAIRVWAHRGILPCDQSSPSAKLWVRLTPEDIERVSGEADVAGMPRVREVAAREGVASADVWARVSSGELVAYRAPRGRDQWEWRLTQHALPNATPSASALLPLRSERTA